MSPELGLPDVPGNLAPSGAPADRLTTLWEAVVARDPRHSDRYIQRFETMRQEGADLNGEARLVDAMLERGSRVLDAGCGPGRIGGELARRGHSVVGVDVDPVLVDAARRDHPEVTWAHGDLAHLDLLDSVLKPAGTHGFDAIVCAGNVMTFLAPGTYGAVLDGFRDHLAPDGRAVIGFGSGRGYDPEQFFDDAAEAGFTSIQRFSTWDLRPYRRNSDFLVAVLGTGA